MIETLIFASILAMRIMSILMLFITITYVAAISKFILDTIKQFEKKTLTFGLLMLFVFLAVAIPFNYVLLSLAW